MTDETKLMPSNAAKELARICRNGSHAVYTINGNPIGSEEIQSAFDARDAATLERVDAVKYFMSMDNSSHHYYVPWDKRNEWNEWVNISEEDERAWEVPSYATRIDGGTLTFENPRIE